MKKIISDGNTTIKDDKGRVIKLKFGDEIPNPTAKQLKQAEKDHLLKVVKEEKPAATKQKEKA